MRHLTILLFVFLVACGSAPATQGTPAPVIGEAVTVFVNRNVDLLIAEKLTTELPNGFA